MALNYQSYHTENYVFPIFYFTAGPGSLICTKGTARLTKAFLQTCEPETSFIIYKVWMAATTLVVVLNAAMILPAFSLASIFQKHYIQIPEVNAAADNEPSTVLANAKREGNPTA